MNNLSKEDYIKALKKLEESPADRIGTLGSMGVIATGASAGALGATGLASMFGATTLFGSSTLASLGSGFLIVSTPIGWTIGTAMAGAFAAYGISKLINSGGKNDERKEIIIADIKEKISKYNSNIAKLDSSEQMGSVAGAYALLLENSLMEEEQITAILQGVSDGSIDAEYALSIATNILNEIENTKDNAPIELVDISLRSSFVLLYKYIIEADGVSTTHEIEVYKKIMHDTFSCSAEYAQELFDSAPLILNINTSLDEIKGVISKSQQEALVMALTSLAESDGELHKYEKQFIEHVKKVFEGKE